jgi:hypothetical protein
VGVSDVSKNGTVYACPEPGRGDCPRHRRANNSPADSSTLLGTSLVRGDLQVVSREEGNYLKSPISAP